MHPKVSKTDLRSKIQKSVQVFLFPEASILYILNEWFIVRQLTNDMREERVHGWTRKQSFAILMGAVVVKLPQTTTRNDSSPWDNWLLKPLRFLRPKSTLGLELNGRILSDVLQNPIAEPQNPSSRIKSLRDWELFRNMPRDKDLDRRSKTNGFLKVLALSQVVEFFLKNIIWRRGIEDPFEIHLPADETQHLRDRLESGKTRKEKYWQIPGSWNFLASLLIVSGTVAIHLGLGWNIQLPSLLEQQLWRITNCIFPAYSIFLWVLWACKPRKSIGKLCFIPYAMLRLYFIAQCFAEFRAAPAGIYAKPASDWTTYWPRFGV
ncbi:hypothetical protein PG993_010283 [Apiospora rasikravindrae]|uniref:Uncharacterized protein n=1 Tax=Apiospora rasikravindrae TaxID=990691 RepID=A0ABR1SLU5_9PEZI